MLHRSFKPAKCKTSLKLATSRLKLLKNRKDVQLKQLKRELAQLLESGQDQTARIRVEHVVREEKTIAAYELLEIYCELIAARLPIIESQKNCPIDLKEAITSIVFATPRCSDIPELKDVRKHLIAKYGKEFVTAAVELRPECGVSRMLVEKLSVIAPDGPTKIKILSGIAEEHNIKWDPKSFGERELKPHEDLLNRPSTFEKASSMQTEPSIVQPSPFEVQAPPSPEQKHNAPVDSEHNARPSTRSENFASKNASGSEATTPTPPHPGVRPSGTRYERMEVRHSYSRYGNSFPSDSMNWNMEFKDATSAAQAAAESAERASMAARAAAELSSRGQYSTESHKSNSHHSRDEGRTRNDHDNNPDGDVGKFYGDSHGSTKISSWSNIDPSRDEGHTKNDHDSPDEDVGKIYGDIRGSTKRSSQPGSFRSNGASTDDLDKLMNDFLKGARYSENSSFEKEAVNEERSAGFSRNNVIKQSSGSNVEFVSREQGSIQTDSFNYFAEESSINENSKISSHPHTKLDRYSQNSSKDAVKAETNTRFSGMNINEQSIAFGNEFFSSGQCGIKSDSFNHCVEESIRKKNSSVSSHSRSSSRGDDYDVSPFKYEIDGGEDPFDHGHLHRDTGQASSYFNSAVIFGEPISDYDHGIIFDTPKYDWQEPDLSPVIESPNQLLSTDTWSPKQNMSGSFEKFPSVSHVFVEGHSPPKFDESSTKFAKQDEFLPVTFDESEGPSSESEEEMHNSRLGRPTDPSSLPQKENIFFRTLDHSQHESHGLTGSFLAEKSDSGSNRKQDLNNSSDDEFVGVNKPGTEVSAQARRKFGFDEAPILQSSSELSKSQMISNDMSSEPFYNQVEEIKNDLFAQTSRLPLVNEVTTSNNTFATESSFNMEDDELFQKSILESGNELKFGKLTGGLRHKGYLRPPYSKIPLGDASSSKKTALDSVSSSEGSPSFSSFTSSVKSGVSAKVGNKSSSRTPIANFDSDRGESVEELPQRKSHNKIEPDSHTSSKEADNKSRLRAPVTFFDSDDEDSVDAIPKQASNSTGRVGSGFSRRTKATPGSGTSSHSKATVGSEASEPNSEADARKIPSRSSYSSETPPNLGSQMENSGHWESPSEPRAEKQLTSRPKPESSISSSYPSETPPNPRSQTDNWGISLPEPRPANQSISKPMPESNNFRRNEDVKSSGIELPSSRRDYLKSSKDQVTSNAMPESNIPMRKENRKSSAFEPPSNRQENLQSLAEQATSKPMPTSNFSTRKENFKSSAMEQPSTPLKTVISASTESPKSSTSSGEPPSRESSLKKASHVHPKLPDYDTIAAQLQSLRSNR